MASYTLTMVVVTSALLAGAAQTVSAVDCNGNGVEDTIDIQSGTSQDCNANGIPDDCDVTAGPFSLTPPVNYALSAGAVPTSITSGDFDGDLDRDLAVGTAVTALSNVSLLFNTGTGSFGAVQQHIGPEDALHLVAADLDADGDLDLALATKMGGGNDAVVVLKNNGSGFFVSPQVLPTLGLRALFIAAADLDGDEDIDLVTANRNSDNVSVLLNNGNGTFAPAIVYVAGSLPSWVTIGDLDGDGDRDLAVNNRNVDAISVLMNNGNGTFAAPNAFAVPGRNPEAVEAADLDNDGDLDLAVNSGGDNLLEVFLNDGTGTFSQWTAVALGAGSIALVTGDLDGDRDIDVGVINSTSVPPTVGLLANNGDASFQPSVVFPVGTTPIAMTLSDLDGDGLLDLAVVDADIAAPSAQVLLNLTAIPFSQDCNKNNTPDECDIAAGTSVDCNANSIPDECDIADGTSVDCNANTVPDECDLNNGTSLDCNANTFPDECDIAGGTSQDCNANTVPDGCDIAAGTSADCNVNGVPDECPGCTIDCECDDGLFCTGMEMCVNGVCQAGVPVCTDSCEHCNEATDTCDWCVFDHTFNGFTDGIDFAFFSGCFGGCYVPGDPCHAANYDNGANGCVDGLDFGAFGGCFGQACADCPNCFP